MNFQLTLGIIKSLCGQISFKTGEAYHRAGKVTLTKYDPGSFKYVGMVKGNDSFQVVVGIDQNGDVEARCTCPTLVSYDNYCQHIAAVMLCIHEFQQDGYSGQMDPVFDASTAGSSKILDEDIQLTKRMLEIFHESSIPPNRFQHLHDTRSNLDVMFICKPFGIGQQRYMFGLEMKVGPKRLYTVKNIREFLHHVDRNEPYVFSKHFIYDPKLHDFRKENDAVIRQLIQIDQQEQMYRQISNTNSIEAKGVYGDRMLPVPPRAWEALFSLLAKAPKVQLEQDGRTYDGLEVSDGPIPLHFEFDQEQGAEGYKFGIQGLERITVMDWYGFVLVDGKLLKLQAELCHRLFELKLLLENSRKQQIHIPPAQIERFMEKVIPSLMKLGTIHIAPAVSNKLMKTPLKAKLYLDRVKDRLLAGLEFQYGDIVINPLEGQDHQQGTGRILMRDGDQERRILELMGQSLFTQTESGYILHDEEGEYDFLYYIVPQLEKLVTIYATSAVKVRLLKGNDAARVTVDVTERPNWLEFRFHMEGIPESEIRNLLVSLEEKRRYHRLPNGALLPLEGSEFEEINRFMNDIGIQKRDLKGSRILFPAVNGFYLANSESPGKTVKFGKGFRQLMEHLRNPDHLDFPIPAHLESVLREYQKYGFQWLKTLAHYGLGGILADDMGLGKTVQSIAFLVSELSEIRKQQQPAMIVSPASLVYNWRNELKKFAPEIRTVVVDGTREERRRTLKGEPLADVIITSYPLLRRDLDMYDEKTFHTLILDEAQVFKNYTTQTAKAVKGIHARYRFALTGTPLENRLEELWSIFDVVFPDLFSGKKAFNELSREKVAKRIRPFLLRRVKSDVLKELPEKIETMQFSELLSDQKKLYVAYLAQLQQETVKHLNQHQGFQQNRIRILAGLTRLRQLCCHPALFVEGYTGSSAKFEQLMEILAECRSAGKRVLLFSQFTEMLGLIGRELGKEGLSYFYLDGKTGAMERVELCSRFNEGERDLFLISLKAGGTGLNLTGADTVILYDLWWNPAVEQQAADRAHRIGQKNTVQVIRLVSQGTVEEKMYELQQKKKHLIEEIIQGGQQEWSSLSEQEIREILLI